jgi:hypothetical protein
LRWTTTTRSTIVILMTTLSLCLPARVLASAGQFEVMVTPSAWCSPAPNGAFGVTGNDGPYLVFKCEPPQQFVVVANPLGAACCGEYVAAQVDAPAGITITDAAATGNVELNSGSGWSGSSFFSGGGTLYPPGSTETITDPPFSSSYWGFTVSCLAGSSCTGGADIVLRSVTLTAAESSGPTITPEGPENLWNQNAPGEWIWNPSGDPWPLTLSASDPSGACSLTALVGNNEVPGPSALPNTSRWQQCPDPTWTAADGASVDTRDYVPAAGSLPLELTATNAARLSTAESESVQVDNDPVGLTLSTPNDANPSVWVNHPVTVDATATAGPSGVGGMDCSVDNDGAESSPAVTGLTVNGDGVHTVSCSAWNNAVDPQGQPNETTTSIPVHIDESPPTLRFQPQKPADPTGMVVDAADSESGVASGSIEMAPAGTNDWVSLPTSLNGAHIATHFDDADRTGPYVFRATSCDNVGNCASATTQLTLPLRTASDSEVSLTSIVNPVRRRVVYERVLVGWHWLTIRRHGATVRIKVGGHFKTIKVVEVVGSCTTGHVMTRAGRPRAQPSCKPPNPRRTSSLQVPYGHSVAIHGLYTTTQGVPLAGQPVHILAAPDNHTNQFKRLTTVTTAADGSWTATLPPGPSRIIRAVTDGTATVLPSSGQVTTIVPADIRLLRVWPRQVAWGGTVHLVGQLLGGYLPPGGALVRLRIGYGSTYNTYGVEEHVMGDGRFSTVASFGPGDPSVQRTYWFQIASLPMGNYPYAPAASQRVTVRVGGQP